jgi:hypothetical protein
VYYLSDIIRVMKCRKRKLARHVACMGKMRNERKILVGDLVVDGRM